MVTQFNIFFLCLVSFKHAVCFMTFLKMIFTVSSNCQGATSCLPSQLFSLIKKVVLMSEIGAWQTWQTASFSRDKLSLEG